MLLSRGDEARSRFFIVDIRGDPKGPKHISRAIERERPSLWKGLWPLRPLPIGNSLIVPVVPPPQTRVWADWTLGLIRHRFSDGLRLGSGESPTYFGEIATQFRPGNFGGITQPGERHRAWISSESRYIPERARRSDVNIPGGGFLKI